MKLLLTILTLSCFTFLQCEQRDCCVTPLESSLNGTWELYKITNGFSQIELTGDQIGYTETIEIDANNKTWVRKRDGQVELESKFKIGKEADLDAIILTDGNYYRWYNLLEEDGNTTLSLYELVTCGAVLADGSNYDYKKRE